MIHRCCSADPIVDTARTEGCEKSTVWIVVPFFNRVDTIFGFTRQMLSQSFQRFRLLIVDHGTVPIDYSSFNDPRITVLKESPNLWWTGAVNAGVRYVIRHSTSDDDFVLVINDDVAVGDEYLDSLVRIGQDHPRTIVGSVCVNSQTKRIMYTGLSLNRLRARFIPKYAEYRPHEIPEGLIPSDILPGRGILIPLVVFKTIGLFDDRHLPHYGADDEFSWRARKRGFNLVVGSRCVVVTKHRSAPLLRSRTTFTEFVTDKRKSGNLPTVLTFSSLCFSRPYALYYTGVHFVRCLLSYAKRSLIRLYGMATR